MLQVNNNIQYYKITRKGEAFICINKNISKIADPFCPKTKKFVVIITKRIALNMLRKKKGIQMEELLTTLEDARVEASPERANETNTREGCYV